MTKFAVRPMEPWVERREGESDATLRGRLQDKGDAYLSHALSELEDRPHHYVEPGTIGAAAGRLGNMLQALRKIVGSGAFQPHVPMNADPDGTMVTSPCLLATEAVLWSHLQWTIEVFHDLASSSEAERRLGASYPEVARRHVSLAIALKNMVRTAVGHGTEVAVWRDGRLDFGVDSVASAIARLARVDLHPEFVQVLGMVAAAYEGRFHGTVAPAAFASFARRVKAATRRSLSGGESDLLIAMEFSRYAFETAQHRADSMEHVVRQLLAEDGGTAPRLLWLSLGRFWATRHHNGLGKLARLPVSFVKEVPALPACFHALRAETRFYRLRLEPDDAFEIAFGKRPPVEPGVWAKIDSVLAGYRQDVSEDAMPVAFVRRVLRYLGNIDPGSCFEAILEQVAPPPLNPAIHIWLPREVPSQQELQDAVLRSEWQNPKLIVARYLAALRLNRVVALGTFGQHLRAAEADREALEAWSAHADLVDEWNAHVAIHRYVRKYQAPDTVIGPYVLPRRRSAHKDALVLAIDIGGTLTKMALYCRDAEGRLERYLDSVTIPTRKPDKSQYRDAAEFAARVDDGLAAHCGGAWTSLRERIVAIGITWPGAVNGKPGAEYVAAPSGILSYFQPFNPASFFLADAGDIRQLGPRQAFEKQFAIHGELPHVRLLNDGVAHVLSQRWQFDRWKLDPGGVLVGLTAGTGSAMAVVAVDSGAAITVLAELGRLTIDIGCPFPADGDDHFPAGTGRLAFNRETLGLVASRLLDPAGGAPAIPSLLVSWILEDGQPSDKLARETEFEERWRVERPSGHESSLGDLRGALRNRLREIHEVWAQDEHSFAREVARRAGQKLADLIATTTEIFAALNVFTGGGPLSGVTGRELRREARRELEQTYGFDVVSDPTAGEPGVSHRLARLLRYPDPPADAEQTDPPGARGAALAAAELLGGASSPETPQGVAEAGLSYRAHTRPPSFASYSVVELGVEPPGRVLFPGSKAMSKETCGYVRSSGRQRLAEAIGSPRCEQALRRPWRDYPTEALTSTDALLEAPYAQDFLVIGARNAVNEWGYQLRLDGEWWRRHGDADIDPAWPVLAVGEMGCRLAPLREVEDLASVSVVTGLPLVIDGVPSKRSFLVSCCSDVAHAFDVDPEGRRGPSREAWADLSELWQDCRDRGLGTEAIAAEMEACAGRLGVLPSHNLLHSVLAQRSDGSVFAVAVTAGLDEIGRELAQRFRARDAVLLDNGGSVGWLACVKGRERPSLLVAGPNHRQRGTAFIVLETAGFLHPALHPLVLAGTA